MIDSYGSAHSQLRGPNFIFNLYCYMKFDTNLAIVKKRKRVVLLSLWNYVHV